LFKEKAKENVSKIISENNKNRNSVCQMSDKVEYKSIDTKKELAKIAGVSGLPE